MNNLVTFSMLKKAKKRLLQMHFDSGVGHIGGNLSALDALLVIFHEYLSPDDKFILSKGHAAGALYTALWSSGRLDENSLSSFHKDNTLLAGHPPASGVSDIPFATGSLGHGLSLAAGTALGFKLKKQASKVVCLTSDGEWQEGSTWEALIFAVHHQLHNLTILVDHNNLQGFGTTSDVASMSPLWNKVQGYDVDLHIIDGHNLSEIRSTMHTPSNKIKLIFLNTIKGKGLSFMENRLDSHYLPLTKEKFTMALVEIDQS